jgi:predicted transcriptional regulator
VREIRFHSVEADAKLLSVKNRALLRLIAERHAKSVSKLATLAGRAEQNALRTPQSCRPPALFASTSSEGRA